MVGTVTAMIIVTVMMTATSIGCLSAGTLQAFYNPKISLHKPPRFLVKMRKPSLGEVKDFSYTDLDLNQSWLVPTPSALNCICTSFFLLKGYKQYDACKEVDIGGKGEKGNNN